jgi:hypothetical protein
MVRVVSHQTLPGQGKPSIICSTGLKNFFDMGNMLDAEVEDTGSRDITSL